MAYPTSSHKTSAMNTKEYVIYVCRHGDTEWNSGHGTERFRSHHDVPLSKEGRKEAEELAGYLKDKGIDCVYTDSLSRTIETAEMIAQRADADIEIDERLRPWDLGQLTGKPVNKDNLAILEKYVKNPDKEIPGGQSLNEWKEEFLDFLDEQFEEVLKTGYPIAVVTHTRNAQISKASEAAEGGFNNHDIDEKEFMNYDDEMHTGELMKLTYSKGEWQISTEDIHAAG